MALLWVAVGLSVLTTQYNPRTTDKWYEFSRAEIGDCNSPNLPDAHGEQSLVLD